MRDRDPYDPQFDRGRDREDRDRYERDDDSLPRSQGGDPRWEDSSWDSKPLRESREMYDIDEEDARRWEEEARRRDEPRHYDAPRSERGRRYAGEYPRAEMGGPYSYGRAEETPRRRLSGHGFRYSSRPSHFTGVGAGEGYSGFGGPGYHAGGYGDPGFETSVTGRRYHGADHSLGSDLAANDPARVPTSREPWRTSGWDHGPHSGRGPKGYQRSPDRIREEVCERLMQHGGIDAREIDVEVEGTEVVLKGTVEDRTMKRLAEDAVESVPGVTEVYNNLRTGGR
jgi:hypothetical protein